MVGNDVKAEWWPMNRRYRGRHRETALFGFRRGAGRQVWPAGRSGTGQDAGHRVEPSGQPDGAGTETG